jgi:hypothetical protein
MEVEINLRKFAETIKELSRKIECFQVLSDDCFATRDSAADLAAALGEFNALLCTIKLK